MSDESDGILTKFMTIVSLVFWTLFIFLPLVILFFQAIHSNTELKISNQIFTSLSRSIALAGIIATAAVLLGWIP